MTSSHLMGRCLAIRTVENYIFCNFPTYIMKWLALTNIEYDAWLWTYDNVYFSYWYFGKCTAHRKFPSDLRLCWMFVQCSLHQSKIQYPTTTAFYCSAAKNRNTRGQLGQYNDCSWPSFIELSSPSLTYTILVNSSPPGQNGHQFDKWHFQMHILDWKW